MSDLAVKAGAIGSTAGPAQPEKAEKKMSESIKDVRNVALGIAGVAGVALAAEAASIVALPATLPTGAILTGGLVAAGALTGLAWVAEQAEMAVETMNDVTGN